MDEKVVVQVLDSCGNNIDEAIKLLGALQLSRANGSATDVSQGGVSKSGDQKDAAHLLLQQQPNASHMPTAGLGRDAGTEAEAKERRKGPAEWVEGLVQQMGSARDMGDARIRAAQELRAFEQAVAHTTNKARQAEVAGLQARIVELSKENALLKRAVTIQQSRLQEAEANSKHQASQAQSVISDLQGKVHSLEVSNYSLSLHLRQATATQSHKGSHPDVF